MRLLFACFYCSAVLFAETSGNDPQARALLDKMRHAYTSLHAVHIIVHKEDLVRSSVQTNSADAEYEFAEKPGGKYFIEMKQNGIAAIVASNGEKTWKALPRSKQWSQIEAAGAAANDDDPEDSSASRDLHTRTRDMLLGRYPALAKVGKDPEFVKNETFKLGKEKIACGVVRVTAGGFLDELWIDQARGLVLQEVQTGETKIGSVILPLRVTVKAKTWEADQDVDAELFNYRPDPGWKETEFLVLPGEDRVSLAGLRAVDFHGKLAGGDTFELSALNGKVVVLDFWATWCGPCMREMPTIVKLSRDFQGKAEFIGINDEHPGVLKAFLRKHEDALPVLLDQNRAVHRRYSVNAIPTLLVIGRDGVIREHLIGGRTEEALRTAISKAVEARP